MTARENFTTPSLHTFEWVSLWVLVFVLKLERYITPYCAGHQLPGERARRDTRIKIAAGYLSPMVGVARASGVPHWVMMAAWMRGDKAYPIQQAVRCFGFDPCEESPQTLRTLDKDIQEALTVADLVLSFHWDKVQGIASQIAQKSLLDPDLDTCDEARRLVRKVIPAAL